MNDPRVVESVTNECQSLGRAHESSPARAEQLIACLEGEIAKRDARILELESDLEGTQSRVLSLQDQWRKLDAELAAIKAQEPVAYIPVDRETGEEWHPVLKKGSGNICDYKPLYAAPAAPAADAGIVDMYRHLQKVTPYRFKKIQDASITDGGDVMYFHKDRFDAALLADMAAHCAAKGVV